MPRGSRSRNRRVARRATAAGRKTAHSGTGVSKARNDGLLARDKEIINGLADVFAVGGGNFPLGARDETWDGGAAEKSYDLPADAACYMWRDSSGDRAQKSSYKLPFVSKNGGKHAVWGAITAIAQRLSSTQIPPADKTSVQGKLSGYYSKARSKYKDDQIQPPWKATKASAVAMAEARGVALDETLFENEAFAGAVAVAYASCDCEGEDFGREITAVLDPWAALREEFADGEAPPGDDGDDRQPMTGQCANCSHAATAHAGEYNDGACSMANCSCDEFEPPATQSKSAKEKAAVAELFVLDPPISMETETTSFMLRSFTFTNETGVALSDDELRKAFEVTPDQIRPPDQIPAGGKLYWDAVLCPEGQVTDDGRVFAPGAIQWRNLPLTLMGMTETAEGHDGAEVCGRIDKVWRDEAAGWIRGSGEFDSGEYGMEIARLVADETLRGISVDIAIEKMEVLPRSQVLDENGKWIGPLAEAEEEQPDEDAEPISLIDLLLGGESEDMVYVILSGVIGAATVCPFQAFREATIEVAKSLQASRQQSPLMFTVTQNAGFRLVADAVEPADGVGSLTASAAGIAPAEPLAAWFEEPKLTELTPLTVEEDGRVYGHAAAWDTCHLGIPNVCTTAPSSASGYAYYHLKEVVCADGERIACGTITMDTGHAGRELGRADTMRHYDDTGTAVADVVAGEDEFGIWVAGALRGDVEADEARKLRGAALSGDWRSVNGNLELVGLLAVNVPGFPVPRTRALVASGADGPEVVTLQAAGVHDGSAPTELRATSAQVEAFKALVG